MTKQEASNIAEMIRSAPAQANESILWAVRHNCALYFYGLCSADDVISSLMFACNTGRDDGIIHRIGLERLEELKGKPLFETSSSYLSPGFIDFDTTEPAV